MGGDSRLILLEATCTSIEVKEVIWNLVAENARGPGEFSILFFKTFWETVKGDLGSLMGKGTTKLEIPSYSNIVLILKKWVVLLGDFRPRALLNSSIKIVSKILANRLNWHLAPSGCWLHWNILDGIVIIHEIIHLSKKDKEEWILTQTWFEKGIWLS